MRDTHEIENERKSLDRQTETDQFCQNLDPTETLPEPSSPFCDPDEECDEVAPIDHG
jgi:hypothetical protein